MSNQGEITVSSHVARDFLQNADYFSTMPKVVWEYVSNALDNPKEDQPVIVDVRISPDRLVFSDNASGMASEDLKRFFQMHGQNIQRQRGRVVRGRFGTGKSAAFGIARTLRIETRKNGYYNVVELTREMIEAASDGKPFGVKEIVKNAPTDEEDGTTVILSRLFDRKRLEIDETRRYVERHLGRNQQNHRVFINDHQC
jgi:HSP90 family molecular chaperone